MVVYFKEICYLHWGGIQRKFTKMIPGMSGLSYHSRLKALNLDSLELRRLRADLLLTYKILFLQEVSTLLPLLYFAKSEKQKLPPRRSVSVPYVPHAQVPDFLVTIGADFLRALDGNALWKKFSLDQYQYLSSKPQLETYSYNVRSTA